MNSETEPKKSPDQGTRLASGTRRTFTWIVELLTIFGLMGFLGSILLNGYVFSRWGLSFLQVASLPDVIMSGLQLSIDLASISVMALLGYLAGKVLYRLSPDHPDEGTPKWVRFLFHVRTNGVTIFTIGSVPLIGYLIWKGISSIYLLYAISFAVGLVVGNLNTAKYWVGTVAEKCLVVVLTGSMLGLLLYGYVEAFLSNESVIGGGVERGFLSSRYSFHISPPHHDCPNAAVLWIGERSLVARCDTSRRILLIDHGENTYIR